MWLAAAARWAERLAGGLRRRPLSALGDMWIWPRHGELSYVTGRRDVILPPGENGPGTGKVFLICRNAASAACPLSNGAICGDFAAAKSLDKSQLLPNLSIVTSRSIVWVVAIASIPPDFDHPEGIQGQADENSRKVSLVSCLSAL